MALSAMEQKISTLAASKLDKPLPKRKKETKEEKKERILGIVKESLDSLSRQLKSGRSETLVQFLSTMAKFHKYSFGNIMLIAAQRPEATHVAGFNKWKELGRSVIKGERGIGIMAPVTYRKKSDDNDPGEEHDDSPLRRVSGFRIVHVFDISQTEGKPLPEFAKVSGDPGGLTGQLRNLIGEKGIELKIEYLPGGAKGLSTGGAITIQPGLPPAEEFAVLVHELAHELLHKSERRAETTKTIRETEAEAVAFVVCEACGIDTSTRSSDYIQLYSSDESTLSHSLSHIQKTATTILSEISDDGEL